MLPHETPLNVIMKKKLSLSALFFTSCIFCFAQNTSPLICPIEILPFQIAGNQKHIHLPDSLGGKSVKGYTALHLFINQHAKLDSFRIVVLKTNINGKPLIEYFERMGMTDEVRRFYPIISSYVKRNIRISPVENVHPEKSTLMMILVRLN